MLSVASFAQICGNFTPASAMVWWVKVARRNISTVLRVKGVGLDSSQPEKSRGGVLHNENIFIGKGLNPSIVKGL